jgi:hypothetical protein
MANDRKQFYVTVFSNASQKLCPGNTLRAFRVNVAQKIELGLTDKWEVCEFAPKNRIRQSKKFVLYGRLHSEVCNVSTHLLPGVRMQIKLTKAKQNFFLMNKSADSEVVSKFLDAQLLLNRDRPNPPYLLAHNTTYRHGHRTILLDESRSQLLFIDNVVWVPYLSASYSR